MNTKTLILALAALVSTATLADEPTLYAINTWRAPTQIGMSGVAITVGPLASAQCESVRKLMLSGLPIPPEMRLDFTGCVTHEQLPMYLITRGCHAQESRPLPRSTARSWLYNCLVVMP
jgi:hypothetical protein